MLLTCEGVGAGRTFKETGDKHCREGQHGEEDETDQGEGEIDQHRQRRQNELEEEGRGRYRSLLPLARSTLTRAVTNM